MDKIQEQNTLAIEDLKPKMEKALEKMDKMPTSEQFDKLNENFKTLKAAVESKESNDYTYEPDVRQARANMVLKAYRGEINGAFVEAFDQANTWAKAEKISPKASRNLWLQKSKLEKTTNTNTNEIDATSGAGMYPTLVDPMIHKLIPIYGVARGFCRVWSGVKGAVKLNSLTDYPNFAFTETSSADRDDSTVTPSSGRYAAQTVQPLQVSGISTVSEKLIWDSSTPIFEDTAQNLAIGAGVLEDQTLFNGDGTYLYGSFTGLTKTTTIGYGATASNNFETVAPTAFTNFDPLFAAISYLYPSVVSSPNTKWHMTTGTFAGLRTLKASTAGLYFYDPSVSAFVIAGYPVVYNQVMDNVPVLGTSASASKTPIILGDLKRAVTMVLGREQQIKILNELYAASNQLGVRLTYDFNYGIVLGAAFTKVYISAS